MATSLRNPTAILQPFIPYWLRAAIEIEDTNALEEIRVRVGKPIQLVCAAREKMLPLSPDFALCQELLECLCEHSVAAYERELAQGYITVRGCRVGISGRAVAREGTIARYSHVTGFNLRLAREVRGCAEPVMNEIYDGEGGVNSVLVLSAPGAGKTTLLRDAARLVSDGWRSERGRKVCIADERGELAGAYLGQPSFDVGARTDVTDGCMKSEAMRSLIRSMSPEVLVTDEIGSDSDAEAIMLAAASGVAVLASAHARDERDAMRKPYLKKLAESGCFDKFMVLRREGEQADIRAARFRAL
ncbi:MAG TPA: stage III sporulation protein AA [Clostridia bacterium]|nr:stage III sporulation protein AA [Clostridia bacterium]